MRPARASIATIALTSCLSAACAEPEPLETRPADINYNSDCETTGCGTNSSVIAGVYFHEDHLGGAANDEEVRLVGYRAWPNGPSKVLDVLGDRLVARLCSSSSW